LAQRFFIERRTRQVTFEDVVPVLDAVKERFTIGVITNGASCLQRQKLLDTGLADRFHSVSVSGELGIGKPDVRIFEHALSQLGATAQEAVMIGDNLTRDIAGAVAAGMKAVWINRHRQMRPDTQIEFHEVESLLALPALLFDRAGEQPFSA
jgi:putative hydrolase of the HAD superfamily